MQRFATAHLKPPPDENSGNRRVAGGDEDQDASSSSSRSSVEYTSGYDSESEEGDDEDDEDEDEDVADGSPDEKDDAQGDEQHDEEGENQAPAFMVPSRTIAALEHPFQVMSQASALESFGPAPQYKSILDPNVPQLSVPIYLHPKDPTSRPIMSHYAASHNIVFKVTVPKRTGRKRKRGSDDPWQEEVEETTAADGPAPANFRSHRKLDAAKVVRRKLQDNVGRYKAEAVGIIKHTHRYRGMVDFNYSMKNNDFVNNFTNTIMSKDVKQFRKFELKPGTDMTRNQAIIAPPLMTQITIPNYYHYAQNPYVRAVDGPDGKVEMLNTTSKVQSVGHFISGNEPTPMAPQGQPTNRGKIFWDVVNALKLCMEERPIWTRRSIINRIADLAYDPKQPRKRIPPSQLNQAIVKNAIQYAGYQFKGGPWRDAVVRYGYDPRTEPEARKYQCLIFRLRRLEMGHMGESWQDIRRKEFRNTKDTVDKNVISHIFDGQKYYDDGKVWQVCDITDPVLHKLFSTAPPRPTCDVEGSGWFHRGLWAKARAIMKCKMRAIQFKRTLADADFAEALALRDDTPDPEATKGARSIVVPTPDLDLTEAEWELVRGKRYKGVGRQRVNKRSSYHFPGNKIAKKLRRVNEEGAAVAVQNVENGLDSGDEDVIMETIEDEHGTGRPRRAVRFDVADGSDGSDRSTEDGSEYDEDEDSEDEEEGEMPEEENLEEEYFDEDEDFDQDELAERIRLSRHDGGYTDEDQEQDDEQDEEVDPEEEDGVVVEGDQDPAAEDGED